MTDRAPDGQYDAWLDAIEDGDPYYVECENGHGWLPPRRICPTCTSQALEEEPLPESGEIASFSTVHVATPQFEDDAPYVTTLARFGPVTITGILRGVDPDDVELGDIVGISVEERTTTGDRLVVFRPR